MVAMVTPPSAARVDQRIRLHAMSWQAYEALLAWRGESSGVRMTFLEGELELMTPSIDHEDYKTRLARLVEAWAEEMDIVLEGAGSWTIKDESVERGAEPDECYVRGPLAGVKVPDFAIEVVWTHGGIDKLAVYGKLGVREVWIWRDGALSFHLLRGQRYAVSARSQVVPELDPALIARCITEPTQTEAVRALRREMRASRGRRTPRHPRKKR